jgi:predicted kinase
MLFTNPNKTREQVIRGLNPFEGMETGFVDNFTASLDSHSLIEAGDARQRAMIQVLEPYAKLAGTDNPGDFLEQYYGRTTAIRATGRLKTIDQVDEGYTPPREFAEAFKRLGEMNRKLEAGGHATISEDQLNIEMEKIALEAYKKSGQTSSTASNAGIAGQLLGAATAEIRALAQSPSGISLLAGAPLRLGILRTALVEGLIAAGQVGIAQKDVAEWRRKIGLGYDAKNFATNVGFAFVGGAAFGGLLKGAIIGAPKLRNRLDPLGAVGREYNKNIDQTSISELNRTLMELDEETTLRGLVALEKAGVPINGEGVAAARHATTDAAEDNPIGDGVGATSEHLERRLLTEIALENNELPTFPDKPILGQQVYPDIHHYDKLDGDLVKVDLDKIEVDAKTFQFKTDANAEGVNMTLQGIDTWNPIFAQTIISYEYANGRLFVADGHQRVGLAKRLKAANPELDIPLYSHLLRETDGVTPEQARVVAALANMAHASPPQIIDAAKVLRVDPAKIAELPAMSVFVRQARDLVELSDEAFGLIINEIVPAQYGSLVGRLVPDPEKQMAVLQILAKTEPSNALQAEAIIRQARDTEFKSATQDTLFGAEEFTQSLFLERARVLESTLKLLKNDRRVFNSLVENQKRIETEGNQLDEASNVQRSMTDAQALEIIKAQADKKGPISDALNLAAREFAEGRSLAETSRTVADAVRRAVDGGDVDGRTVSLERIDADVAEEGNRLAAGPERLDEFDEPNGKGSQDQADAAETTLREETEITEAAQPDVALREDLGRIIDEGATPEQIDAHPAVTDALERAMAIPLTKEADGYGGDAWRAGREFRFGDETVVGYEAGVQRLYENAKRLGWENDGKTFPGQIEQGRRATIMLGPPASGKSYFANKVAQARNAAIVDSDEAKKVLPEYDDGIGATAVHAESTTLAEEVLRKVISNGDNFVIPRTGKALSEIEPIIAQLKENGYQVDIILMQVSADTAYKRMISRFIATGRLIPPDVVRGVGNNPQITYNAVKSKADRYAQIENESPIDSAKGVLDEGPDSPLRDVDLRLRRGSEVSGREPYRLDATEPTPQGQQTLVEGVEPITDATRAQAAVDAPLTGGNRPMDEGLFDTAARGQGDLLDMDIPVGQRVDADGNMVAENQTVREMLQEFDQDKNMIKRLEGCV